MTSSHNGTSRPFTVALCTSWTAGPELAVVEELRATIRRCKHGVLVTTACMLDPLTCAAPPSRHDSHRAAPHNLSGTVIDRPNTQNVGTLMSLLSRPRLADPLSWLFARVVRTTPNATLRFPEITGWTTAAVVPTRHGEVAATIYHPPSEAGATPPVYLNVHGGGFVVGHPEDDDPWCRYLAARAKCVVVNTGYALAPRWRFPVPVEQVYDVVRWASSVKRNWDGSRLCVGGQSAGDNLCAAAARLALENGGPQIKLQVLHYPLLDLVTRTKDKHAAGGPKAFFRPWMGDIIDAAYIPDPKQRRDRLASPAWGTNGDNIKGIAPALVITAELDRLHDETAAYARKLDAAGSLVEYRDVLGVDHGYNILGDSKEIARQIYDFIADHVASATTKR